MTIDANGRTWIGTPDGLSILNKDSIFNLTESEDLPDNHILTLYAERRSGELPSSENVVWFGTKEGGLLRFERNQLEVFQRNNSNLPDRQYDYSAHD